MSERSASKHNENDREEDKKGGLNQNFGLVQKKKKNKKMPAVDKVHMWNRGGENAAIRAQNLAKREKETGQTIKRCWEQRWTSKRRLRR
jgi:hypothetical protein